MGHYDSCRGYCNCGRHESEPPSNCGRENCSKYREWVRTNDRPEHKKLIEKWDAQELEYLKARMAKRKKEEADRKREAALEKRRLELRQRARKKLTPAERKAVGLD